jgi:Uma2 family endonuclease
MATRADELRMTLAEFLRWDDGTDTRYELVDGCILSMAPPNDAHGTITVNLAVALASAPATVPRRGEARDSPPEP